MTEYDELDLPEDDGVGGEFLRGEAMKPRTHEYDMGFDCGKNGANTTNCHFGLFSTRTQTTDWERGKRDGEKAKGA